MYASKIVRKKYLSYIMTFLYIYESNFTDNAWLDIDKPKELCNIFKIYRKSSSV